MLAAAGAILLSVRASTRDAGGRYNLHRRPYSGLGRCGGKPISRKPQGQPAASRQLTRPQKKAGAIR